MARGRFITLEGGDGAGKSTQSAKLCAALGEVGVETVATREPGGSPGAEEIRTLLVSGAVDRWADPITEAMLHFAARRDHVRRTIEPALARGAWVVSDRFSDSTMAYQGFGQGGDRDTIARLRDVALGGFAPDLTIILDLPAAEGLARAAGRGDASRYERMDPALHDRIRAGFKAIAEGEPKRCVLLEATGDADTVHQAIKAAAADRLGVTFGA